MIRAIAYVATMGVRPGGSSWLVEFVWSVLSVVLGSFALMASVGLVLSGLTVGIGEPYFTFAMLMQSAFMGGLWLGAFGFAIPTLMALLAQVVPWWIFRYQHDPILLPLERAKVRFVLLAFWIVVPFAGTVCGCLGAMAARDPACEIITASTRPDWVHSMGLDAVAWFSLVAALPMYVWFARLGLRRVDMLMDCQNDQCPQCLYNMVGLSRCPECGWQATSVSNLE